jgi:hypothetical protein
MSRSTKEILAQAEEFAKRFEDYEPAADDGLDARSLRDIHAFVQRAEADREISDAVAVPRAEGTRGRRSARCLARRVRRRGSATAI